ncbi:ATP-binding protein [Paraburkholderia sediminicola]|uniref:two-component system sensor histidine kinase NtrB n=1 Tax=Paraburkholderia sediminicola TaxID=458836 RepID=UPI0038BC4D90
MSFILPTIVASETTIILLLLALRRRPQQAPLAKWRIELQDRLMRYVARAISDAAAVRPNTSVQAHGVELRDISVDLPRPVVPPERAPMDAFGRENGENYFREMLTSLLVAILILNERGMIVMLSPQAAELFGYRSDELIGKPVELLVHDLRFNTNAVDCAEVLALLRSRVTTPPHEYVARRKNGTKFHADIELKAFRFGDENVTLAFIADRTDRYELACSRRELFHVARVSTVGQLAPSLAHELNQPLTAILSNTQAAQRFMMADHVDLVEVREILADIVRDNYRASEVIRHIRSCVRKSDPEVAPLDLASLIREVALLVRNDAIVRGVRVVLDVDNSLPPVQGDSVQLQQVLLNLLLNAFDATEQVPAVDRVVTVTLKSAGSNVVCMSVRDCGRGLTSKELEEIFNPFYTSKPQGLGLGLSIGRSIIDMHRGRLWAENNVDRGATFFITLPTGDATERKQSR